MNIKKDTNYETWYTLSKELPLKMHTELKLDNMKFCQVESIKIPPEKILK